ncbi:MAG: anti-sigma factor [Anaerolineae bacterium]|nr:anti-sigma factor [Gloeobacterales cyanobacterium ES-bin-313]
MNEPNDREAQLIDYVLGEMAPEATRDFEQLLATDLELASEVARLRRTLGVLPYSVLEEPPVQLREKLLTAAANQFSRRAPFWQRVNWGWGVATVAALATAAFALDGYRLRQELKTLTEVAATLQEPNVVLVFSLRGTGTANNALGSLAMDLDQKRAAIAAQNLPVPPTDKLYRLWAVVGQKNIPCGQFRTSAQGGLLNQFTIPVEAYSGARIAKLFVTLEPASLPPQPTGPTVMTTT